MNDDTWNEIELDDLLDDLLDEFDEEEENMARARLRGVTELNDFEDYGDDYAPDESEERYNKRVFNDGMIARKKKASEVFFDPSQIEGAP